MNIVYCSSEVFPFAKTGGLGDVAGSLPKALAKAGCTVKVFMPFYRGITAQKNYPAYGYSKEEGVEFYFIRNDRYFNRDGLYGNSDGDYWDNLERFTFFSKKVLSLLVELKFSPDIININDWQTCPIAVYLKAEHANDRFFDKTKVILTIHNMAYQGCFDKIKYPAMELSWKYFNMDYLEFYDEVCLLKGGIVFADMVNTVSPNYAKEIQTEEYGCGLEGVFSQRRPRLTGILNAVDYRTWDPAKDKVIYKKYSPDFLGNKEKNKIAFQKEFGFDQNKNAMLVAVVSRLAYQKGIDLIDAGLEQILKKNQVVILGFGDEQYQRSLKKKQRKFPGKLCLQFKFDEDLAHKIYAASDLFLIPSRFEPCGLSQMISYKYGVVPVANPTGGLVDTVTDVRDGGGGLVMQKYSSEELVKEVERGRRLFSDKKNWSKLQKKIMGFDFSWEKAAENYIKLYKKALNK